MMVVTREVMEGEVIPWMMMGAMEACTIVLTITATTAIAGGMSPFVFVVYTNALSSIFLLPYSLASYKHSRIEQPFITFPLLIRCFVLGLVGITIAQNLAFVGLSYSSPIVACGMGNLIPSLSFLLGLIVRSVAFDWRGSSSRARVIGTLISIAGAISLTLYKGPVIRQQPYSLSSSSSSSSSSSLHLLLRLVPRIFVFSSRHENWVLGCISLAAASLALSLWNIIQVGTVKLCPEVMKIASVYTLIGTIQTAIFAMFMERDPTAWRVKFDMQLLIIVLTAIFGSVIRSRVQLWCMKLKGPFYVPLFKPLGIPIATFCGCVFFADTFHYGSMMGAAIVGIGYYAVMWGQMTEHESHHVHHQATDQSLPADAKRPLLQEPDSQV
ncbi:WAT1-related protein At1g70260 [Diospyros lotus]|uniref:WAT1-related protein At1g70260 n=1 Tax=Diospyros lotus TaxID=55363 RepID=UPI002252D45E|nr:WAT1-related protein At1g70260 [Diospyros lotus]